MALYNDHLSAVFALADYRLPSSFSKHSEINFITNILEITSMITKAKSCIFIAVDVLLIAGS
jgi:hypothetical protein